MILINLFYQFIELHISSLKFRKQSLWMCVYYWRYKELNIFIKYLNVLTQKIKIILYVAFSFPLKACIKILNIGKCLY